MPGVGKIDQRFFLAEMIGEVFCDGFLGYGQRQLHMVCAPRNRAIGDEAFIFSKVGFGGDKDGARGVVEIGLEGPFRRRDCRWFEKYIARRFALGEAFNCGM